MIRTKDVGKDFVDDLEFNGKIYTGKDPKGAEVSPKSSQIVNWVLNREPCYLNEGESEKYREFLLLPATAHHRSQHSHDDRL